MEEAARNFIDAFVQEDLSRGTAVMGCKSTRVFRPSPTVICI